MTDLSRIASEIASRLDIRAEYETLGIEIVSDSPGHGGWLSCRAHDREDRNPSAGVNVGDGPARGRYKEFTGDGRNLSLFDAAVAFGKFTDWRAARKHFADKAGVTLTSGRLKTPDAQLVWHEWDAGIVQRWCDGKPPIKPYAVRASGGRLARYPAKSKKMGVLCLPVYGPNLTDSDPVNWYMTSAVPGRMIGIYQGEGREPLKVKGLGQKGFPAGWIGRWGCEHVRGAEVVWKVEGIPDLLALMSALAVHDPQRLRSEVVMTSSHGAVSILEDEHRECLRGKLVNVVGDCDEDGQRGAERWAAALRGVAAEVRIVKLPYEVTEKHGKDLRDWLNERMVKE
jgi:hypothetical protein